MALHPFERRSLTRRGFLIGSAVGLGAGLPVGAILWQEALKRLPAIPVEVVAPATVKNQPDLMPGRAKGRVSEVYHAHVVDAKYRVDRAALRQMLDKAMCAFTGADHPHEAWRSFFQPGERIGIKVNPVGLNRSRPNVPASISHPLLVLEVIRNLREVGIPAKDIVLFDRYGQEFVDAGYDKLTREREAEGVRWMCASGAYTDQQTAINGVEYPERFSNELLRHIVGYDPDHFIHMPYTSPAHDPKDDRRYRSHLTKIVTQHVDKFITLPVLKDHRSSGVTLSLKNMSHGLNNNVARSHISPLVHGQPNSPGQSLMGPNQCSTFIPAAVNQPVIRQKAALHILDGLIGVYEGGPGVWNYSWATWAAKTLYVATDPVTLDHLGWDVIDTKRTLLGLPRVGEIGRLHYRDQQKAQMILARLAQTHPLAAVNSAEASEFFRLAGQSEIFDRRHPEHVFLAGTLDLGEWDLENVKRTRHLLS